MWNIAVKRTSIESLVFVLQQVLIKHGTYIYIHMYIIHTCATGRPSPTPYLFHVGDQRLPVHVPFLLELRGVGIFAAAQLHRDFQTVSMEVVVVLHSS